MPIAPSLNGLRSTAGARSSALWIWLKTVVQRVVLLRSYAQRHSAVETAHVGHLPQHRNWCGSKARAQITAAEPLPCMPEDTAKYST